VWHDQWHDTAATGGRFVRRESQFRSWVTPVGTPGPAGESGFRAELDEYAHAAEQKSGDQHPQRAHIKNSILVVIRRCDENLIAYIL
jgi:hypothetical protein